MSARSSDPHEENADALAALAPGQGATAAGTPGDATSGLMMLSQGPPQEQVPEPPVPANPVLGELAATENLGAAAVPPPPPPPPPGASPPPPPPPPPPPAAAIPVTPAPAPGAQGDPLGALAAAAGANQAPTNDADMGPLADIAAASSAVGPTIQPQRAARLQANVRRVHSHAYKRMMIPVLLVVGAMLIGLSAVTLIGLLGDGQDPDSLAAEGTYLRVYGKYMILASLPLGAILLMGAWLFYIDVKRSEARMRR